MNSSEIHSLICEIAGTPGKNDKTSLLAAHIHDADLKKVLDYAYNPFSTYGIRKLPQLDAPGEAEFNEETWATLDALISRKLSGNAAFDAVQVELRHLNRKSGALLRCIILKDLKAGFGESTINKVCKGLIPSFPYMRCSLPSHTDLSEWDWQNGIISQEKADGMFVNINNREGGCDMTTRQGSPLPYAGFEKLHEVSETTLAKDTQTHGEMLVVGPDGKIFAREIGNGMLNSVIQGGSFDEGCYPILVIWDQVPLSSIVKKGKCLTPYKQRLAGLFEQTTSELTTFSNSPFLLTVIPTRIVRSLDEAYDHYRELLLEGKEGTIIKQPSMIWKDYTSKEQIKLKLEADCELEVIAFVPGDINGKHANTFGSLRCASSCRELIVDVSGFKDDKRAEIHAKGERFIGTVLTVRANSILFSDSKAHSLFLPRFIEERLDKSQADDFNRIKEQFDNAMKAV